MKKLLYILLLISFGATAQIKVGVQFDKNNPADNSFTAYDRNINGGYHTVQLLSSRDSLLTSFSTVMRDGLMVFVRADSTTFQWHQATSNWDTLYNIHPHGLIQFTGIITTGSNQTLLYKTGGSPGSALLVKTRASSVTSALDLDIVNNTNDNLYFHFNQSPLPTGYGNVDINLTLPNVSGDLFTEQILNGGTIPAWLTAFRLGASTTSGYVLTANSSGVGTWQPASGGGAVSSLTTTGTSGASTLSGGVLNIPVYTTDTTSLSNRINDNSPKLGIIFNSPMNTGEASKFTSVTTGTTYSFGSTGLTVSGTSTGYYNDFIYWNNRTLMFTDWIETCFVKINTASSSVQFGVGYMQPTSKTGPVAYLSGGYLDILINGSLTVASSTDKLIYNTGDVIKFTVTKLHRSLIVSAVNTATNQTITCHYSEQNAYLSNQIQTVGYPCITTNGGNYVVTNLTFQTYKKRNVLFSIIGDSITDWAYSDSDEDRWAAILQNNLQGGYSAEEFAIGGASFNDALNSIVDIVADQPRFGIINLGVNDALGGASCAGILNELNGVLAVYRAYNIQPIIMTANPWHNGSSANPVLKQYRDSLITGHYAGNYLVIDTYDKLVTPGQNYVQSIYDSGDGHPNKAGHLVMGQEVVRYLDSVQLFTGGNRYFEKNIIANQSITANGIGVSGGSNSAFNTINGGYSWQIPAQGTDGKNWDATANINTWNLRVVNDANTSAANSLVVTRSGMSITGFDDFATTSTIHGTAEIQGLLYHRSDINVLNKAQNGWIDWLQRDITGSEAQVDISNANTITANSFIKSGGTGSNVLLDNGTTTAKWDSTRNYELGSPGGVTAIKSDSLDVNQLNIGQTSSSYNATLGRIAAANAFTINNTTNSVGGISNAINQTSTSQYITFPDTGFPNGTSINMSVSLWFRSSTANTFGSILSFGSGGNQFEIFLFLNNKIGININGTNVGQPVVTSGSFYDGVQHNIIVTISGSTAIIYYDGTTYSFPSLGSYNIALSGTANNNQPGNIVGVLDQLLIYNRTLTSGDVSTIYNSGVGTISIPTTGLIRAYEFENGTGVTASDSNPGTHYNATLQGGVSWTGINNGIVPTAGGLNTMPGFYLEDGVYGGESSTVIVGDTNSGAYIEGHTVKTRIDGSFIPIITAANGTLIAPGNSSQYARSDPSAALQLSSTTQGFLQTPMTFAQMNAISSPATGLRVLVSDRGNEVYTYNGSAWVGNGSHTIFTPTTGSTITAIIGQWNLITPSTALASLTITLPSSPYDGMMIKIKLSQTITTLNFSSTVANQTPSTAGAMYTLIYDSATSTWY